MAKKPLPKEKNIYETDCPILYTIYDETDWAEVETSDSVVYR